MIGDDVVGGLEIAVVADRLQPGPPKLRRDVLGRDIQTARGSVPPFEEIRREKPNVTLQGLRGNPVQRGLAVGSDRGRVGGE